MAEGWICPRCGRIYGPNTEECKICNANPLPMSWQPYKEPSVKTGDF